MKQKLKLQKKIEFTEDIVNEKIEKINEVQDSVSILQQKFQREKMTNAEKLRKIEKLEREIWNQKRDAEGVEDCNKRIFGGLNDKFQNELRLKDQQISELTERLQKKLLSKTNGNTATILYTHSHKKY